MAEYEITGFPIDLSADLDPIKPGAQWGFSWNHYDANEVLANTTGWTVSCHFREEPESNTTLAALSVGSGITNDNGGTMTLTLTAAQTALFKTRQAYFDIYITHDGITECPFQGEIEVLYRVTRSE